MALNKIDPTLAGRSRARLEARKYEKNYTEVPNTALPEALSEPLRVVYEALTGEDLLPDDDFTFLVKSDNGTFKRVYSPAVFATPKELRDEEGNEITAQLVIKWGKKFIPLNLTDEGKIISELSPPAFAKKAKLVLKKDKFGKYDENCIVFTLSADGDIYSMPFPLRLKSTDEPVEMEVLEAAFESNIPEFVEFFLEANNSTTSFEGGAGSGAALVGPIFKPGVVPMGEYDAVAFRRYKNQYGVQHLLQVVAIEDFTATTRSKSEDGEWEDKEVQVKEGELFILKANKKLSQYLTADPLISVDNPGKLDIYEQGEFNGAASAKLTFSASEFQMDADSLNLSF